jgi:hypothetical protein
MYSLILKYMYVHYELDGLLNWKYLQCNNINYVHITEIWI